MSTSPSPATTHTDTTGGPERTPTVVHVVTNVGQYPSGIRTGLWLGELVHVWDQLEEAGFRQILASPAGGVSPLEPKSLVRPVADASVRARHEDPAFLALLERTVPVAEIDPDEIDAVYLTGGHGTMFDFPECPDLAALLRAMDERGKIVSSVCHGYCGFIGATDASDQPLVAHRELTGFSWAEEIVAGVAHKVPFNVQKRITETGAVYSKARLPMASHVVVDGTWITGQNPGSARGVGAELLRALGASTG